MATFTIPCSWEVCSTIQVEANTLEEAINIAEVQPRPANANYVAASFRLHLEEFYEG